MADPAANPATLLPEFAAADSAATVLRHAVCSAVRRRA